jgi:uncharacterized protein YndB with AHSA1/START domain
MFTYEKTIFINRQPQEVFDYITNPDNDSEWRTTAVSAEWTSDGPVGVQFRLRYRKNWLLRITAPS